MIKGVLAIFVILSMAVYTGISMANLNGIFYDMLLMSYGKDTALIIAAGMPLVIIALLCFVLYKKYSTQAPQTSLTDPYALIRKLGIKSTLALFAYEIIKSILTKKR